MKNLIEKLSSFNIHAYGSEQALKQEAHVARFLSREYQMVLDNPTTLDEMEISTISGPMWEETDNLMETHYDEKFEFFDSFLDSHYYAYTMAYYGDTPEVIQCNSITLEEAQKNKFHLICDRIGLEGNERILNLGCGFGSFERYLKEYYPNTQVIGVTPSKVQVEAIRASISSPDTVFNGLDFKVILKDVTALTDEDITPDSFDVVCSIGLLEQSKNMRIFHEKIARYLKSGGKAFHHMISSRITIPQFINPEETLIGDYFPGGRIWPMDELPKHTKHLEYKKSWYLNGMNYWTTLDEWHRNFWQNMEILHKHLSIERIRFWSDYFILCKACFSPMSGEIFGNAHHLFRKP